MERPHKNEAGEQAINELIIEAEIAEEERHARFIGKQLTIPLEA